MARRLNQFLPYSPGSNFVYNSLFLRDLFDGTEEALPEVDHNSILADIWLETSTSLHSAAPPPLYTARTSALYKPSVVRGVGSLREGYCSTCDQWFRMKTSSYWYHMNYKHGISTRGRICPEPRLRIRAGYTEGYCGECHQWILLGATSRSIRFGWFRHWQKLHCKAKSI